MVGVTISLCDLSDLKVFHERVLTADLYLANVLDHVEGGILMLKIYRLLITTFKLYGCRFYCKNET